MRFSLYRIFLSHQLRVFVDIFMNNGYLMGELFGYSRYFDPSHAGSCLTVWACESEKAEQYSNDILQRSECRLCWYAWKTKPHISAI